MTFLPIVHRELRAAARRPRTHWTRLAVALGAIVTAATIYVAFYLSPPQQAGAFIFKGLAVLLIVYALASGRLSTVDCLSEEKREGTLGLLFLTDLKGYDVVLGKLVATSLNSFYGLLAVFPVLAVPLLLGGVTNVEFWRIVLLLVNTFLYSLAIGIFCSALSRDARKSIAGNFALLLLLTAVLPACAGAILYLFPSKPLFSELFFSSPVYAFYLGFDANYKLEPEHFWLSVAVIHGLTWLLVLLASWIVPFSWQDKPSRRRDEKPGWRGLWHTWSYGDPAKRNAFRKRLLDVNAFYWLAGRARLKPTHVWIFLGLMAIWWIWGWINSDIIWFDEATAITATLLLNTTLKLWIALEAGQRLAEDRKSGVMELLLSTPLSSRDILRGQLLALRRQFLRPLLVVSAVELVLAMKATQYLFRIDPRVLLTCVAAILMLAADAVTLSWVAMRMALTAKTQNHAVITTVSRVLVLPWVMFLAVVGIGNLWSALWPTEWSPGWKFHLGWWFGLGILIDLAFGLMAWRQLQTSFRQLANQRFSPPPRFARWLFRGNAKASESTDLRPSAIARASDPLVPKKSRRKRAVIVGVVLVLVIAWITLRGTPQKFPPPIIVSITQSNGPLRVFPGGVGVLMVLPDGSLWRWGQTGGTQFPKAVVAEQVGTNSNWEQAVAFGNWGVGLLKDGTLGLSSYGLSAYISRDPQPWDRGHDWIAVAAGGAHSVALKRDGTLWAWGDNSMNQLGNGPGSDQPNPVQIGTNNNWAAITCDWGCTLGLRTDGTLWIWGKYFSFGSGQPSGNIVAWPTQVCRETNWVGLTSGFLGRAWTRSGELWNPFYAPPNADAAAASTCRLVISNSAPDHVAFAFCGQPKLYEVRSNGTLWEKTYPIWQWATAPADQWRQVGKRADWVSIWSGGGTALGLTSDGTVWTWGYDPSREPVLDFSSKLKLVQVRVRGWFGALPAGAGSTASQPYQNEPRPLMRLLQTN